MKSPRNPWDVVLMDTSAEIQPSFAPLSHSLMSTKGKNAPAQQPSGLMWVIAMFSAAGFVFLSIVAFLIAAEPEFAVPHIYDKGLAQRAFRTCMIAGLIYGCIAGASFFLIYKAMNDDGSIATQRRKRNKRFGYNALSDDEFDSLQESQGLLDKQDAVIAYDEEDEGHESKDFASVIPKRK